MPHINCRHRCIRWPPPTPSGPAISLPIPVLVLLCWPPARGSRALSSLRPFFGLCFGPYLRFPPKPCYTWIQSQTHNTRNKLHGTKPQGTNPDRIYLAAKCGPETKHPKQVRFVFKKAKQHRLALFLTP